MSKYQDRARRYQEGIHEILMEEWDPIGVAHIPEAQDEYDSYIPSIYSRLIHRSSEDELFEHLWEIETVTIGLYGNPRRTRAVVKSLLNLREMIDEES